MSLKKIVSVLGKKYYRNFINVYDNNGIVTIIVNSYDYDHYDEIKDDIVSSL